MGFLFRVLPFAFLIWVVCYFFYSLGRRKGLQESNQRPRRSGRKSKVVESIVVEEENDTDDSTGQKQ